MIDHDLPLLKLPNVGKQASPMDGLGILVDVWCLRGCIPIRAF